MHLLFKFLLYAFVFSIYRCIQVEISLIDNNTNVSLKIFCGPPSKYQNINNKFDVLWHGYQLEENELDSVVDKFQTGMFMPNMTIHSSKSQMCYLTVPNHYLKKLRTIRKRMVKNDGSVPMEEGTCPPGHRIDEDRCYPCFPGSYTSGQQYECFLCPKDFYMDKKAADVCWPCPGGKKTLAQGADSEESCTYFDETGHAVIEQSPPWTAIFILIGVILICVWIAIIILWVRYWKKVKIEDRESHLSRSSYMLIKQRLDPDEHIYDTVSNAEDDEHIYDTVSNADDEEPIYAEIGDYDDDTYEIPIQPTDIPSYVDLDTPPVPPKRKDTQGRTDSISKTSSKKSSEDQYEIPIKRPSKDNRHSKYSGEQSNSPTEKHSDDLYEVPIQKFPENNNTKVTDSSEDYHDSKDHIYAEIGEDEYNSNEKNNIYNIASSRSAGFDPAANTPSGNVRQVRSHTVSSKADDNSNRSSTNRKHSMM